MRPRNRLNRNLPPNLYISKKGKKYYFRYRHPGTGKETGMGSDRVKAVSAANELNGKLMPTEVDLVSRVIGGTDRMSAWLDRYVELLNKRDLADASLEFYKKLIKVIRGGMGDADLSTVDTRMVAQFIEQHEHKPTMARHLRSRLKDIFDEAIREGKITHNPVTATRSPKVTVMRSRLSLDLRLDVLGMTVGGVVSCCRDRVVSRHLVHHNKNNPKTRAGAAVNKATISRGFKNARNLAGLTWDNPPSFHEIRSLSGRLYKDQGIDPQSLLGHKSAETTALYIDVRGSEWMSVG